MQNHSKGTDYASPFIWFPTPHLPLLTFPLLDRVCLDCVHDLHPHIILSTSSVDPPSVAPVSQFKILHY